MPTSSRSVRHAAVVLCWTLLMGGWPSEMRGDERPGGAGYLLENTESISSSRVLIWYRTAPGSTLATRVDLWYTSDRGQTWELSVGGTPATSPIAFDATSDGLYGFYLVLHNSAGASAPPPASGTAPQRWVRVDRAAPRVKLLGLAPDEHFDINREIHIRWAVQDDNLRDRPVQLHYRDEQGRAFRLIADLLAENSSCRWTVPEGVSGRIEVKISAIDRAGNVGHSVADWLRIDREGTRVERVNSWDGLADRVTSSPQGSPASGGQQAVRTTGGLRGPGVSARPSGRRVSPLGRDRVDPWNEVIGLDQGKPPADAEQVDSDAAKRAKKRYDLGTWHRHRGEYAVAVQRYQEALDLDPHLLGARNDLAGVLFLQGEYESATREYQCILEEDPRHRAALKGLALLESRQRNYRTSRQMLEKLLLIAPEDAEAWLYFGDVTMFTGERRAAREAWKKVEAMENADEDVRRRAQRRLAIYKSDRLTATE